MKSINLARPLAAFALAVIFGLGPNPAQAQITTQSNGCAVIIPPAPSNSIYAYVTDYYPDQYSASSLFDITMPTNGPIPAGTYAAWCVDANTVIDPRQNNTVQGTYYTAALYSTSDSNELANIPTHNDDTPPVGPPPVTTMATWHEVNYILNHRAGYFYWDVQCAINTLVGGPPIGPSPPYPPATPANIAAILAAATNNAASWTPTCGDVVGVIMVVNPEPEQILILEVPCCAINFTTVPTNMTLGCNPPSSSIPTATNPVSTNVAYAVSCCGRPVTVTCQQTSKATVGCTTTLVLTYTATDGLGSTATTTQTITWTTDTNAPTIIGTPAGGYLGCNPTNLPSDTNIFALLHVSDNCATAKPPTLSVTHVDSGSPCGMMRTFTITALDGCGNLATNTVIYTYKIDTNAPAISVPTGSNLGCNPTNLPTDASILALIKVSDNCGLASTNVSHVDTGSPCGYTRTFSVIATDGCGNKATNHVVYTFTIDTNAPTIVSVPAGGNLGVNPTNLPTDATVMAQVKATDNCTVKSINVSYVDSTNICTVTRTFTVTATDECGNTSIPTNVVYTWSTGPASACGYVFHDCNGDGVLTPGIDFGICNLLITLKNTNGVVICTNHTSSQGYFCFTNLPAGTYTVCVGAPANCNQTAGCHVAHWLNNLGQDCWIENDGYQHCKANGYECWTAKDGYLHCRGANNTDCWKDNKGVSHSQPCAYVSCNIPKSNCETFTLVPCGSNTNVCFAYQGIAPQCSVTVKGPASGICGQTLTYTCTCTNTGNACFSACKVTCCGNTHTCPPLEPGQGCSFTCTYTCKASDYGNFNCQANASCTCAGTGNSCTGSGSCITKLDWH